MTRPQTPAACTLNHTEPPEHPQGQSQAEHAVIHSPCLGVPVMQTKQQAVGQCTRSSQRGADRRGADNCGTDDDGGAADDGGADDGGSWTVGPAWMVGPGRSGLYPLTPGMQFNSCPPDCVPQNDWMVHRRCREDCRSRISHIHDMSYHWSTYNRILTVLQSSQFWPIAASTCSPHNCLLAESSYPAQWTAAVHLFTKVVLVGIGKNWGDCNKYDRKSSGSSSLGLG